MSTITPYLNLITSEHRDKPKFIAMLSIWLNYCNDIQNLLTAINASYDIDNAIGNSLDIIGIRIGASRTVVLSSVTTILNDTDFRVLLKATIFKNNWKGTTSQLSQDWAILFPLNPLIIKDNQNMTMDVVVIGLTAGNQPALVSNGYIVPQPQGIGLNFYSASLPIFAFGVENSTMAGFGTGQWISIS